MVLLLGTSTVVSSRGIHIRGYHNENGIMIDIWRDFSYDYMQILHDYFGETQGGYINITTIEDLLFDDDSLGLYIIAHGGYSYSVLLGGYIFADNESYPNELGIKQIMEKRNNPFRLVILYHCGAMMETGEGTFSYEYIKGDTKNNIVFGLNNTQTSETFENASRIILSILQDCYNDKNKTFQDAYNEYLYDDYIDYVGHYGNMNLCYWNVIKPINIYDANMDSSINILDALTTLNHVGKTDKKSLIFYDINNDQSINILDAIIITNHFS